jgi:hypothetical protein
MFRSMKDLEGYAIGATDGAVGHVKDFFFDDHAWVIRYLVVDTGEWLSGRKVLISPMAIGKPDWDNRLLPVSLTRARVRSSPDIDTDMPVSRQHEMQYSEYYRYPHYWGGTDLWGGGCYPGMMLSGVGYGGTDEQFRLALAEDARAAEFANREHTYDPHLRSCKEVRGYHISASDGDIGHVQGILVEEDTWAIRYIVVDTSNWWIGHQVLVSPEWVRDVRWTDRTMAVDLDREAIKLSPSYMSTDVLNREFETSLYAHHKRRAYWQSKAGQPPGRASSTNRAI